MANAFRPIGTTVETKVLSLPIYLPVLRVEDWELTTTYSSYHGCRVH